MSLFDVGTMTELLNRSLTGGVVILAVLALRLMMRRFPRKYVCILWLAAFGRLLFSIPVPAASSLFPAAEPLQQAAVEVDGRPGMGTVLRLSTGLEPVDSAVNELLWQLLEPSPATSADPVQIYAFAFQWLWLGGMAVLLLTGLFRYGLLKRRISDAVPGGGGPVYGEGEAAGTRIYHGPDPDAHGAGDLEAQDPPSVCLLW